MQKGCLDSIICLKMVSSQLIDSFFAQMTGKLNLKIFFQKGRTSGYSRRSDLG